MFDILHEVIGSISRNKMRAIATGFAVASGLFLMIVLQGASNGVIHTFENYQGKMSYDAVHVFDGCTTKPHEGMKAGRIIRLDQRDVDMVNKRFQDRIMYAIPAYSVEGVTATYGDKQILDGSLKGVYPQYNVINRIEMAEGRFINKIDLEQKRKVVVISDKNVNSLFPNGTNAIGKDIIFSSFSYRVIGVYKANWLFSSNEYYVPYTTLRTIYNKGRNIDEMSMIIRNISSKEDMDNFITDYTRATSQIHDFAPDDREAMWMWNQAEENITMNYVTALLHTGFWILGLLTLISGIVGVSNIMLISVKERTREFGVRRAIGARPGSIVRMVMLESVILTAIFGYIGMFLGVFFCEWMDTSVGSQTVDIGLFQLKYFQDPTVDLNTCLIATCIIIVAGALAGFFPARKAVKMKTIDALRA